MTTPGVTSLCAVLPPGGAPTRVLVELLCGMASLFMCVRKVLGVRFGRGLAGGGAVWPWKFMYVRSAHGLAAGGAACSRLPSPVTHVGEGRVSTARQRGLWAKTLLSSFLGQ